MRWLALALLAVTLFPSAADAQRRLRVRVVDVAGGRAFISPGAARGVHAGARVTLAGRRFRVAAVTESYGAIDLGERSVRVGGRGVAVIRRRREGDTGGLDPPTPLAELEGRLPEAQPPAIGEQVEHVPLGSQLGGVRQLRVHVSSGGQAYIPLRGGSDAIGRGEVRVRVHAQPFVEHPFTIDADAAVQFWLGDRLGTTAGARARPNLRVRQLQIAWGNQEDFYAALGRLRYAAATVGQLDGLRVQTPRLGPITLSGFGGFVPDPQTGEPAFNTVRFGLEATYQDVESEFRPVVSIVGQGSVFDGQPDERRVTAAFHLYPGESHIGGYVEVSNFDEDNPWGARVVDVTAASLDTTLRFDWFRFGFRAAMRQPERSNWLASLYPPGFLCTQLPNGTGPDRCDHFYDHRLTGNADVGFEIDDVAGSVGATIVHVDDRRRLEQLGAFATFRAVRLLGYGHFDLSVMFSSGEVIETWAGNISAGAAIIPEVIDFSLRYRPAYTRYDADINYFVEHTVGARVLVRPIPTLDILLNGDVLLGRQLDAFIIQLSTAWHEAF